LTRITVDEDEWEKVKTDIKILKRERSEQIKNNQFSSLLTEDTEGKQKTVLEFIRKNPNINKQKVVDHFEKHFSRTSVYNIIKDLVKYEQVIDKPNENNRHTRCLIINENSVLLSVIGEMDNFKKHFFRLLDNLKQRLSEIEGKPVPNNGKDIGELLSILGRIYEKFVSIYMAILAWTNKINDKQILFELYKVIVSNIMQIQLKYSEFGSTEHFFSFASIPYNKKICTDDEYDSEIKVFEGNGLEKEIVPVVKVLDKINYRYGNYTRL
jgi:hypothetical protein